MGPFSALILDSDGDIPLFVARCLGQIPDITIHIAGNGHPAPVRFSRYCHSYHTIRYDANMLTDVLALIQKLRPDVLLPILEPSEKLLATHFARLSKHTHIAPVPATATLKTMNDKWALAQFLQVHQLPHPETILYTDDTACRAFVAQMEYPALLKPLFSSDGKGIRIAHQPENVFSFPADGTFLVQSFVEGYDIDCSVLCKNGEILAHTIQRGFIPRTQQFAPPAGIEFVDETAVLDVARAWARAANWDGIAHIDMRFDTKNNRPIIIEVNPRFWGSVLGSLVAGVNFPYLTCLTGMNEEFSPPQQMRQTTFVAGRQAWLPMLNPRERRVTFARTSWRFAAADPIAEIHKTWLQAMNWLHWKFR